MRRRAKASSAIAAICCGIVLCLCASSALAASKGVTGFFGGNGTLGGQFGEPSGLAISQNGTGGASPGDVYVVDGGNFRVQEFSADGDFVRAFGLNVGGAGVNVCTEAASCTSATESSAAGGISHSTTTIAIEQSTGNVYVGDMGNDRIDVFSATGTFEGAFGWNVNASASAEELQFCTALSGCQQGTQGFGAGQIPREGPALGLAVSPLNGHLIVGSGNTRRVDEFAPTLTGGVVTGVSFSRGYGWGALNGGNEFQICTTTCHAPAAEGKAIGQFGVNSPSSVAVDSSGRVHAVDLANSRIQDFSAAAAPLGAFAQAQLGNSNNLITVDPADDHVFGVPGCGEKTECHVVELDSAGTLLETYLVNAGLNSIRGIAAAAGGGNIYLAAAVGGQKGVLVLSSSPPVPPHVTIQPVATFTGTTATFVGHVNPESAFPTGWHFEYSANGSNWTNAPEKDVTLPGGNAEHAVSVEVEGLEALTHYQVRLVATKQFGAGAASAETSFDTPASAPLVSATSHSQVSDTEATLEGEVNPESQQTEYSFEYVDEADFEAEGFAGAASIPAPPGRLEGGEAQGVVQQLSGLTPDTTYHARLTATNQTGTTMSAEDVFTTFFPLFAGLPDGRVYEQATPLDKNGNNATGLVPAMGAASDGNAVTFNVTGGAPGAEGEQDFSLFLASRSPTSWSSQGLFPPATTGPNAQLLGWGEDLSHTYSSNSAPGGTVSLYQRDSATHALHTIVQAGTNTEFAFVADVSDGSKALFESKAKLLPNAMEGKPNVYAWDRQTGALRLASALNGPGEGTSPSEGALAGPYDWFFSQGDPKGGSVMTYYAKPGHALAGDGSAAYFTALGSHELYLRRNPTQLQSALDGQGHCTEADKACTVDVSASQRTVGGGPGGSDALGPKPKAFMEATPNGSRVLFTSPEQLTNDANTGPEPSIVRAGLDGSGAEASFIPAVATGIAVDGSHVYWANPSANAIGRAKIDGSQREPLFITGASNPQDVAVNAEHVYWTNAASEANGAGSIGRANINGGEASQSFISGANNPRGIALDSEHLYWVNASATSSLRKIGRAKIDGTEVNQSFITTNTLSVSRFVAVDSEHIYWTTGAATIGRAKLDGTELKPTFMAGAKEPKGIAVDGSHIYWANASTKAIGRANLDGTSANQAFAVSLGTPEDVALDGSHLYWSSANPGDKGNDLYRYDAEDEELTDLSVDAADPNGAEVKGVLGSSRDGSYVYFAANGVLTSEPNPEGETATLGNCTGLGNEIAGSCNLYLWHEGSVGFIARLKAAAGEVGLSDTENWRPLYIPGNGPAAYEKTARVSADGQTLLFRSQLPLTGYDNERVGGKCTTATSPPACPQLFRYEAATQSLLCVSCDPTGNPPLGPATLQSISVVLGAGVKSAGLLRNLSADGNRIFFETPDQLVAGDVNGNGGCPQVGLFGTKVPSCQDVYEWEAKGQGSCESEGENGGCLYLLSSGASPNPSYFADASESGDDAFIFTTQQLVGQDKDELQDIYDARVGGGIASQNPLEAVPCEGEACKGGTGPQPSSQTPGTSTFSGPGNPPPKHVKHRRRRHKHAKHRKHRSTHHKTRRHR